MCVVENLSRVFLSEWPLLHLWVIMVYIVWGKGNKVTLIKRQPSMTLQLLSSSIHVIGVKIFPTKINVYT